MKQTKIPNKFTKIITTILTPALFAFVLSLYLETTDLHIYQLNPIDSKGIFLFALETRSNLDVVIDNITIEYDSNQIELEAIRQDGLTVTINSLYTGGTGFVIDETIKLHRDQVYVYGIPYVLKGNHADLVFKMDGKIIESKWPWYLKLFPPSKKETIKTVHLLLNEKPTQGDNLIRKSEANKTDFKTMQFRGKAIEAIIEKGIVIGDRTLHMDWKPGEVVKIYFK